MKTRVDLRLASEFIEHLDGVMREHLYLPTRHAAIVFILEQHMKTNPAPPKEQGKLPLKSR